MSPKNIRSEEIVIQILRRLSEGESLRAIMRTEGMPLRFMFYEWMEADPELNKRYVEARNTGLDTMADQILEIADDSSSDFIDTDAGKVYNAEHVNRSRLRIDSRKWFLSKLYPRRYGEKTQHELTGADGGPIETKDTSMTEAARRIAFLFAAATKE